MNNQLLFDYEAGRAAKEAGIKQAVDHADKVSPGWSENAYKFLLSFLSTHTGEFMAEEVRSFFALHDFELPPSNRAFGGIILKAARAGLIRRIGYKQVKNPKAHMANAAVWVKNYGL